MPPIRSLADLDLTRTYTYADYLTWQLGEWVELLRGRIRRMSPAPTRLHQQLSGKFYRPIANHLWRRPCEIYHAPFDVRLTTRGANAADDAITTVVQPDLCVICDPAQLDDRGCVGAPDWIIEILSPGTAGRDINEKFTLYEENGVTEYWIVAPGEKNISVFVLENDRYKLIGDYWQPGPVLVHTLPDLVVEWSEVFEG